MSDVDLREGEPTGLLNLRGDVEDAAFLRAAADVFEVELPLALHGCSRADTATAYWLGPDEWLIAVAPGSEAALEAELRGTFAGRFAVTDTSSAYARFELWGAKAEEVLRKSSSHDFHPSVFPPNRCVQTIFAKTHALISLRPDHRWELLVRTSYTDYVRRWFTAAMAEYS